MTRVCFIVSPDGVAVEAAYSDAVSRAYDIMTADRVPPEKAAELAVAAEKSGRDPVAFAGHFVKVRREFRQLKERA